MTVLLVSYLATGLAFLILDAAWLTTMGSRFYRPQLGDLVIEGFRLGPAAAFYFLYVAGMVFFAVQPALANGRWTTALGHGAALGFIAYATYDLTNQATIRGWPPAVTLVDMAWGTVATALAATAGFLAVRLLLGLR